MKRKSKTTTKKVLPLLVTSSKLRNEKYYNTNHGLVFTSKSGKYVDIVLDTVPLAVEHELYGPQITMRVWLEHKDEDE